jgi:hypothetical protein
MAIYSNLFKKLLGEIFIARRGILGLSCRMASPGHFLHTVSPSNAGLSTRMLDQAGKSIR